MIAQGYLSRPLTRISKGFASTLFLGAAALVYVMIGSHLLHPRYIVNDNIINLNFIVAGYPVDYMGIFLTGLLHRAYALQPAVPWYALCLYGVHVMAVFMWLKLFWRVFKRWWLAAAFSAAFFAYYLSFLIELDYTSTSELLCISSLAWACLEVLERRPGYWRYLGLGVVFMLGISVRPQGFIGAVACVFPVAFMIAGYCLRERRTREELLRLVFTVTIFLTPALLNCAADAAYRQITLTPQQAAYEAFNAPRGLLHALSPERQGQVDLDFPLLRRVGWNIGNAQNLFNWRFLDERIYTPEALRTLAHGAPRAKDPIKDMGQHIQTMLQSETGLVLLLLCSLPFFLAAVRQHPWLAGFGLLLPVYCVVFDSFLSAFLTFRDRTEMPFVASFGFLSLVLGAYLTTHPDGGFRWPKAVAAILGLLLVCYGAHASIEALAWHQKQDVHWEDYTRSEVTVLNDRYAGSIVLQQPIIGLQLENLAPLEVTPLYFHPISMVWDTFSPLFYDSLMPLGVRHGYDLIDAMVDNKNAYFAGDRRTAQILLDVYAYRYKGTVRAEPVRDFHPGVSLYRFVSVVPAEKR